MKRFLGYVLFCAAGLAFAQGGVTVEAFDEQANNPGQLTLRLRATNGTGNTLQNVRFRYFLPFEQGRALQLSPYYLAGTIFAPKAKLVLGQAEKEIYGRFVGNGITVHQYADFHAIPFNPLPETTIAYFNSEEK